MPVLITFSNFRGWMQVTGLGREGGDCRFQISDFQILDLDPGLAPSQRVQI